MMVVMVLQCMYECVRFTLCICAAAVAFLCADLHTNRCMCVRKFLCCVIYTNGEHIKQHQQQKRTNGKKLYWKIDTNKMLIIHVNVNEIQ